MKQRKRFDARQHGATTPTHVRGKFTNTYWRDYSDPRHERGGMKDDTLEASVRGLELRGERYEHAWIMEKTNTGWFYPVTSIKEEAPDRARSVWH